MTLSAAERYGSITPLDVLMMRASTLFDGYGPLELSATLDDLGLCLRSFRDGEVLARDGIAVREMAIVLSGYLHVYDSGFKGKRHLVKIVGPGQVIGASLVMTHQAKCPALVKAFGAVSLAIFPIARLHTVERARTEQRFFDNLHRVVGEAIQASWRKIAALSCLNIEDRIMLYLHWRSARDHSKIIRTGAHEEQFADFLGASRTAYIRVLRNLVRAGKISCARGTITLTE